MFSSSVTDFAAAKRLACILKTLLGLEVIIKLVLMININVIGDSEILI